MTKDIKVDARIAQTRSLLLDAIEQLLRERPGDEVTVSTLCATAGVSRTTFYQHFRSTDEVIAAALESRLERIRASAERTRHEHGSAASDVPKILQGYLDGIWKDRQLYRELVRRLSPYIHSRVVMSDWLQQSVAQFLFGRDFAELDKDTRNRVAFGAGGFEAAVAGWLQSDDSRRNDLVEFGPFLWRSVCLVIGHLDSERDAAQDGAGPVQDRSSPVN